MLENTAISDGGRLDLDAVSRLVIRLMGVDTSLKHPQTMCLSKPDVWNLPIRQFLEKTFLLRVQPPPPGLVTSLFGIVHDQLLKGLIPLVLLNSMLVFRVHHS